MHLSTISTDTRIFAVNAVSIVQTQLVRFVAKYCNDYVCVFVCCKYASNYGKVAYFIGNARRAVLVAILPDNCHPFSWAIMKYNAIQYVRYHRL